VCTRSERAVCSSGTPVHITGRGIRSSVPSRAPPFVSLTPPVDIALVTRAAPAPGSPPMLSTSQMTKRQPGVREGFLRQRHDEEHGHA
jgi:hypothetical protein